ncbi:unnamed protein product [Musa acuminata subsp. malaccensis]|uniref:(wild Malaysian banana) hypothetical protein n=1 Tax=Musa acuminata subsp. malaccensis TaxID=214687 RepID=A0A804J987_MUSAM|nr:unnamed protein product [Musa acuminata subsp. malaccensis]
MGIRQAQSRLSAVSSHPFGAPIGGVRVAHLLSPPFVPTQVVRASSQFQRLLSASINSLLHIPKLVSGCHPAPHLSDGFVVFPSRFTDGCPTGPRCRHSFLPSPSEVQSNLCQGCWRIR